MSEKVPAFFHNCEEPRNFSYRPVAIANSHRVKRPSTSLIVAGTGIHTAWYERRVAITDRTRLKTLHLTIFFRH
jgi:hypothetical protein